MSYTKYHESHYVTVLDNRLKPPFSIRPEDYFKTLNLEISRCHLADYIKELY